MKVPVIALLFGVPAMAAPDYLTEVKPLFASRCFDCHGGLKQKAKLRVDTVAGMLAGEVVVPGKPGESELFYRVSTKDVEDLMPPKHEGVPFTPEELETIRKWIATGAVGPKGEKPEADPREHWSFQPVKRPGVPCAEGNPIDAFLAKEYNVHGLTRQPGIPKLALIRRLYIDLIGLPPEPAELDTLLADDSPDWYTRLVDKLLDDPRHGERWGRHWMDVWRYSDWWGLGAQLRFSQKHIWHWRDWIIESLNDDLPYDEMVRLMLAVDELYPDDQPKLRASGFLARNFFLFNRNVWMDGTVEHVSKGLLGLTMNCSKCHDHKFDPLSQEDYYGLRAIFEPYHVRLDLVPGQPDLEKDGIPRVYDGWLDKPTYRYIRGNEANPDESKAISPAIPAIFAKGQFEPKPVSLPEVSYQPGRRKGILGSYVEQANQKLETAKKGLAKALEVWEDGKGQQLATAYADLAVAKAGLHSVKARVEATREAWEPGGQKEKAHAAIRAGRQLAMATAEKALLDAQHKVCNAAEDKKKGAQDALKKAKDALAKARGKLGAGIGEKDTFAKLPGAKWTPTRFKFSGRDDPPVEFQPKSTGRRTAFAEWVTSSENPLTARVAVNHIWLRHMGQALVPTVFDFGRNGSAPTHPELLDWLAAEFMESGWGMKHIHRLVVTSQAYRMDSTLARAGDNVAKDPDNQKFWRRPTMRMESQVVRDAILSLSGELDPKIGGPTVAKARQAASKRRSLYFFHSNNERNLFLRTFDEAMVKECYQRETSVVPQQALALANGKLVLSAAPKIAARIDKEDELDDSAFVRNAFAWILGIEAGEAEVAASVKAMEDWRDLKVSPRANLVWALLNHNDFVTVR